MLDTVTVTSQKRTENLQKVPISIEVLGEQKLDELNVTDFEDYVKFLPSVSYQSWFQAKNFPHNLPAIWEKNWAYLKDQDIAPVLLGEFGGQSVGNDTEGKWQRTLVSFIKRHGISYTYWCWNPDSGDTGGILNYNWQTVDNAKLSLLRTYQAPLLLGTDRLK